MFYDHIDDPTSAIFLVMLGIARVTCQGQLAQVNQAFVDGAVWVNCFLARARLVIQLLM